MLQNDFKMGFHKHLRLKKYDYSEDGAYFVIICTFEKKKVIDKKIKKLLTKELRNMEIRFRGVKIDFLFLCKIIVT